MPANTHQISNNSNSRRRCAPPLMRRALEILAWAGILVSIAGCGVAIAPIVPPLAGTPGCPNPMAVIKSFYDSNDAGQYDASLALLAPDATLATWGEGVNGRHWAERTLTGEEPIRTVLGNRGLRRSSGQPDAPIFHETEAKISGDQVAFMLRPDRLGPYGRQYDPYAVTAVFQGCQIKSLTVVERFTAP